MARTSFPLNTVNVRLFKFGSKQKAVAWRMRKYESEEAKPLYKKSEEGGKVVFDSLQMKKRIIFRETLLVTCHIGKDDIHLKVLKISCNLGKPPE
jgi:hypothetical protein